MSTTIGPIALAASTDLWWMGTMFDTNENWAEFGKFANIQAAGMRFVLPAAIPSNAQIATDVSETYLRVYLTLGAALLPYVYCTDAKDAPAATLVGETPVFLGGSTLTIPSTAKGTGSVSWVPVEDTTVDIAIGGLLQLLVSSSPAGLASGAGIVLWHVDTDAGDGITARIANTGWPFPPGSGPTLTITYTQGEAYDLQERRPRFAIGEAA